MTVSRLTEDDFSTIVSDLGDYVELPVLELNEGDYLVSYGHLEKEEFLEHCNQYIHLMHDDSENSLDSDIEVLWTYAKPKQTPGFYKDEWEITWKDVHPDDEDGFPITLVNLW